MSERAPAIEFRDAAIRMVAATEYFKAVGELPSWARAELESWRASDPVAPGRRSLVSASSA